MVFALIIPLITLTASIIVEYATLTRRRALWIHVALRIITGITIFSAYVVLTHWGIKVYFFYYLVNIVPLLVCFYLFKESIPQKFFLFFTTWSVTTFLSALCHWGSSWLADEPLRLLMRVGLYLLCYLIFIPLYIQFWRRGVKEVLSLFDNGKPIYALFPFLVFVLFSMLFGPLKPAESLSTFIAMILFSAFVVLTYFLMISHFREVFNHIKAEINLKNSQRQLSLEKRYYEELAKRIQFQRERLHDTRHHIIALGSIAKTGNVEAVKNHLTGLLEFYSEQDNPIYCENTVVNAVVGGYIQIAEKRGVTVRSGLHIPQDLGINEYELCTLFGNTIENALEACERIPQSSPLYQNRFIDIKSRLEKNKLIIRIENSWEKSGTQSSGDVSSKGVLGGVGLDSVRAVVDAWNGSMSCEQKEGVFIFSAVLTAPLPEPDKS